MHEEKKNDRNNPIVLLLETMTDCFELGIKLLGSLFVQDTYGKKQPQNSKKYVKNRKKL